MSEPFNLMAFADEGDREGGGYICQFRISGGYLVFATGPRENRFFEVSNEDDVEEAKSSAKELADKHNTRYHRVVSLELFADSVINKEEKPTWQGGVWAHDFVVWQDAYKEILRTSLEVAISDGLQVGEKAWGNISFKSDPRKPERPDGQPNLKPYIVRYFATREEAEEYALSPSAEEDDSYPPAPAMPEEWVEQFPENSQVKWTNQWRETVDNFVENPDDSNWQSWLWEEAGLTEEFMGLAMAAASEMGDDDIPF